jgi:hypothetical protein
MTESFFASFFSKKEVLSFQSKRFFFEKKKQKTFIPLG